MPFKSFKGIELVDKIINIDQSPIGRTPRSNPATYTGAFGPIRDWFTSLPESKSRGYKPGRFSFNVRGGRCEACEGDGVITYEMHFLPDVYITCDECKGSRYNRETLEIKFKDKSIADVLNMTVDEGCEYFENIPNIRSKLLTLKKVGLGYIKIGQVDLETSFQNRSFSAIYDEMKNNLNIKNIAIRDTGIQNAFPYTLDSEDWKQIQMEGLKKGYESRSMR